LRSWGWVYAGLHGVFRSRSGFGFGVLALVGLGLCRVAAFSVSGLRELAVLFITISHCAWRHVISLSKAKGKNRPRSLARRDLR
jgi:hypothetical protein